MRLSLDDAIRLIEVAPDRAAEALRDVHERARELGDRPTEYAALSALRMLADLLSNSSEELLLAEQLVRERGEWFDVYWLGAIEERRGRQDAARGHYMRALKLCSADDPDRDLLERAAERLRQPR